VLPAGFEHTFRPAPGGSQEPRPSPPDAFAGPAANGTAQRFVVLPKHLHARPAAQLARVAARHRSATIELVAGERRADARSVLAVMRLGALAGTEVGVVVTGSHAEAIADEVARILRRPEERHR